MAKVIINGMEVEGSFEDIQIILGIKTESARTESVKTEKPNKVKESKPKEKVSTKKVKEENKVDEFFDKANLVQVQESDVVDLGIDGVPKGHILTSYKVEYAENVKLWRVSHTICGSSTYKDSKTGEEKTRTFNKFPKKLANAEIKKLPQLPEFAGELYSWDIPFTNGNGHFKAYGFKTKELAEKALEILPKFVAKDEETYRKDKEKEEELKRVG